jgi:3-hydroxyisobutyrate dehydrogenase-like beta-hydroxyacid dehydrogenase
MQTVTGPVVGILYAGDMGSHLGSLLHEQGLRVVTTLAGRSGRTCRRAREANLEVLGSVREVVETADVILSLVPPTAAVALAEQCASWSCLSKRKRVFVDLNSISPGTLTQVENALVYSGMRLVDGAVHGVAAQLRSRGVVYLSGPAAAEVAELFRPVLRVKVVGTKAGDASALRMTISILTKGLMALFLETSLVARQAGILPDLLACCAEVYPGIMSVVERILPTYPQHALRRADELKEVEETMHSLGLEPGMVTAARQLIAALGQMDLSERAHDAPAEAVRQLIEEVFAQNPLQPEHLAGTL